MMLRAEINVKITENNKISLTQKILCLQVITQKSYGSF